MRVIGIGDNVCDQYVHQMTMYPGGQTVNFTVYATMLGAEAAFIGVFGTDEVAAHVMKTLDGHGIDRSRCRQYEGENGRARVNLVDGDRVFLGSNKGGVLKDHPIELDDEDIAYAKGFEFCHTSNNSYMDPQLPKLKAAGIPVSYDFSGQWIDEERVARVCPYIEFAFLSAGSVTLERAKEIAVHIHEAGAPNVTVTRGGEGALFYDGENFYEQKPHYVVPVDTLGAGDSFATAFLLNWFEHKAEAEADPSKKPEILKAALEAAAEFSSGTCKVYGAFGEGVPFTL